MATPLMWLCLRATRAPAIQWILRLQKPGCTDHQGILVVGVANDCDSLIKTRDRCRCATKVGAVWLAFVDLVSGRMGKTSTFVPVALYYTLALTIITRYPVYIIRCRANYEGNGLSSGAHRLDTGLRMQNIRQNGVVGS